MKQVFHKIVAFLMAFVVLFSTMSFTIDMHYCGDTLVDSSIFHKAETCGMEMEKSSEKDCSISKKNCCSNEQLNVEGTNELQNSIDTISFEQQLFISSFIYTYINLFEGLKANTSSFETYRPPLVNKLIFKLDETYLI
ncbi:HYC_CC_PP family protein [Lutibacter citreus]|uniref:HYC_CC_PP family protein n=1 Tax=Lutibacter citreus TaxID=2138210 RepID=UPI000DBE4D7F|nr:hypothetical protein [Lutibacter citreus]